MIFHIFTFIFFSFFLAGCGSATSTNNSPGNPNIIFILADDMGYGDVQIINPHSKIPTPNLDKLAGAGMLFTNAHTPAAVCTPTRYSFLTGEYSWRSPMKKGVSWVWEKPLLDSSRFTIATLLKQKGYYTGLVGKWHLGWEWPTHDGRNAIETNGENIDYTRRINGGPTSLGFDYYFGSDVPSFPPHAFIENDYMVELPTEFLEKGKGGIEGAMMPGWKYEDLLLTLSQKSIEFVEKQSLNPDPFFLFYSLSAPHTPIAPHSRFQNKSLIGPYGDFIMELDYYIGDLIKTLERTGQSKNTIVIFTSDNGPTNMDGSNYAGDPGSLLELGHDSGAEWKGLKSDSWEAGHRVPFFVSWPGMIKPGSRSNALISLVDMMATFSDLYNMPLANDIAVDSHSLLPLWKNETQSVRNDLIIQSGNGILSLIEGDWKLITSSGGGGLWSGDGSLATFNDSTEAWYNIQLYNLEQDPSETLNLADSLQERVHRMILNLKRYIKNGRTTAGNPLKNKGEQVWESVKWMNEIIDNPNNEN